MRAIGLLGVAALVLVGLIPVVAPGLIPSWLGAIDGWPLVVNGVVIGAAFSASALYLLVRFRFGRLVEAAEKIAEGDYTITVRSAAASLQIAARPKRIHQIAEPWPTRTTGRRSTA